MLVEAKPRDVVVKEYSVSESMVSKYVAQYMKLQSAAKNSSSGSSESRIRSAQFPIIESAVAIWMSQMRKVGMTLEGSLIQVASYDVVFAVLFLTRAVDEGAGI